MTSLEAIVLGLIQGLSQFLPVSSSGHLVIAQALLGLHQKGLLFEVTVHVATLVSVLVFYRRRVGELVLGVLRRERAACRYAAKLGVASLPAVIVVLLFGDFLEAQFERPAVAGVCLLVTGFLLWTTRRTSPGASREEPSWLAAALIGCAQAFAILPGISRSGSTVAAALALGVRPVAAAEFGLRRGGPAAALGRRRRDALGPGCDLALRAPAARGRVLQVRVLHVGGRAFVSDLACDRLSVHPTALILI